MTRLQKLQLSGIVEITPRNRWNAVNLDELYTDLIETIFETFHAGWDEMLLEDRRRLDQALRKREDGWCPSQRTKRSASDESVWK